MANDLSTPTTRRKTTGENVIVRFDSEIQAPSMWRVFSPVGVPKPASTAHAPVLRNDAGDRQPQREPVEQPPPGLQLLLLRNELLQGGRGKTTSGGMGENVHASNHSKESRKLFTFCLYRCSHWFLESIMERFWLQEAKPSFMVAFITDLASSVNRESG